MQLLSGCYFVEQFAFPSVSCAFFPRHSRVAAGCERSLCSKVCLHAGSRPARSRKFHFLISLSQRRSATKSCVAAYVHERLLCGWSQWWRDDRQERRESVPLMRSCEHPHPTSWFSLFWQGATTAAWNRLSPLMSCQSLLWWLRIFRPTLICATLSLGSVDLRFR